MILLTPDHPRIRGEHLVMAVDWDLAAGSSPHTRGARRLVGGLRGSQRIIPAYAGSTADVIIFRSVAAGSSPHTRGARSIHMKGDV